MPQSFLHNAPGFQEALLNVISKSTFDFIGVVREDDRKFVFVNDMGAVLFGYEKPLEMIGVHAPSLRKKSQQSFTLNELNKGIGEKGFFSVEEEFVKKDGKSFWGYLQLNHFKTKSTDYLLVQIVEIDRAKKAEERLENEKKRFGALLDHASIGVIIVNQKQEIVLMNPFAIQLFEYDFSEVKGKRIETFIPSRFHERHHGHQQRYYANQENRPMGIGMDLFAIKKDGTEFPVEVSLGMYKADDETFVIAFINDITIRKKAEEEIKKLNAELEQKVVERTDELALTITKLEKQIEETEEVEAELRKSLEKEKELNELKSRFVSMASHEFRTPLSTILSSIYLLQKYTKTEDQLKREKHIDRVVSAVTTLTDILNDFLSVGKIEEGKIAAKFTNFNINDHIKSIINELSTILKKGQQMVYQHIGAEKIWLDPSLLKHIAMNLLSNAIKFSPENSTITIQTSSSANGLEFRVKDEGLGIGKEDQQHLFERFFRGTNVTAIQGTGLGLHIVQKYAELMNGKVSCESELEKGTEFILQFDLVNE